MVDLGSLNEGKNSRANAFNDDGRIVAGWDASLTGFWRGALWTDGQPMLLDPLGQLGEILRAYLIELGATGLEGWRLENAQAMSIDGSVIVGHGLSPQGDIDGFVATLHFAGNGSVCP